MERDKAARKKRERERACSSFPFSLVAICATHWRAYSFITYSVPIARLEIMRHIRTGGTRESGEGEGHDINSGLDASLIARAVNDIVISAITNNGGHSMKINRETERNERKLRLRPRYVNPSPFGLPAHFYRPITTLGTCFRCSQQIIIKSYGSRG